MQSKILPVAALKVMTASVIFAAATYSCRVQEKCTKEREIAPYLYIKSNCNTAIINNDPLLTTDLLLYHFS